MTLYPQQIIDALKTVRYPGTGKSIVEMQMVEDDLRIAGLHVSFSLIFDKPTNPFLKSLIKASEAAIHAYVGKEVEVEIKTKTQAAATTQATQSTPTFPNLGNIIAVSSGKGGVGKSTVAANLAVALARLGHRVGLLDCDIFGPSVPKMFQLEGEQIYSEERDGKTLILPAEKYGVKVLSIGFFVDPDTPTLWRGGMASNALKQLIADADWGDLDYFILDTPPGTSDIRPWCRRCPSRVPSSCPRPSRWRWPMRARGCTCTRTRKSTSPSLGWWRTWPGSRQPNCRRTATTSSAAKV